MIAQTESTFNDFELTKAEVGILFKNKPKDTVLVWRDVNFKRYLSFVSSNLNSLELITREVQLGEEGLLQVKPIQREEVINFLSPGRLCAQTYLDRKKIPQQSGVTYLPAITIFTFIQICEERKISNKDITKLLPKSADLVFDAEISKKIISMVNRIEDLHHREKLCTDILNDVDNPHGYLLKLCSKKPLFGKSDEEKEVSRILENTKSEIKSRERQKQLERERGLERERAATVRIQQQAQRQSQREGSEKQRSMTSIPRPKQPQNPTAHNLAMLSVKHRVDESSEAYLQRSAAALDDLLIGLVQPSETHSRSQGQQIKTNSMAVNSSRPRADSLRKPPINIDIDFDIPGDVSLNENIERKSNLIPDEVKPAESNEGSFGALFQFARDLFSNGDENASNDQSEESQSDEEGLSSSP